MVLGRRRKSQKLSKKKVKIAKSARKVATQVQKINDKKELGGTLRSIAPAKGMNTFLDYFQSYNTGSFPCYPNAIATVQMKLNSLYDLEGSITNMIRKYTEAQPYRFDQYKQVYNKYVVYKVRCKWIVMASINTTSGAPTRTADDDLALVIVRDNSTNNGINTNMQLEACRDRSTVRGTTSGRPITIKRTFYMHKLAGKSLDDYISDPNNSGFSNSSVNPSNLYYANISVQPSLNACDVVIFQWMRAYVKFYEIDQLAMS